MCIVGSSHVELHIPRQKKRFVFFENFLNLLNACLNTIDEMENQV